MTASTLLSTAVSSHPTSDSYFTSGQKWECVGDAFKDKEGQESRCVSLIVCGGLGFDLCCCTTWPIYLPSRHLTPILHPRHPSSLSIIFIYLYPYRNVHSSQEADLPFYFICMHVGFAGLNTNTSHKALYALLRFTTIQDEGDDDTLLM